MAYLGQEPVVGRYILIDQISGGFNGTTSGFTLAAGGQGVIPGLAQNLILSLGGVIQQPSVDYTISGSGLTFTTPPISGTTFFATVLGDAQAVGTPSDGTVIPASISTSGTFVFPNITTTGITLIASGNATTPSLAVIGDLNTGIYSPGADQIAISTNGSGRLFVDASGNISLSGAGTGTRYLGLLSETSSYAGSYTLQAGGGSTGFGGGIVMYGHSHASYPGSVWIGRSSGATGPIMFGTGGIGPGSEQMRITSAGFVGIGTSTPDSKLSIENARSDTAGSGWLTLTAPATSGKRGLRVNTTNGLCFDWYDGSTWSQQAVLTSGGNVGIGSTSPGSPLTVESNAGNQVKVTYPSIASYYLNVTSGGALAINKDGTEYSRWDSSGRLLVGTSTARSNFLAGGASALVQIERAGEGTAEFSAVRNVNSTNGGLLILGKSRSAAVGGVTTIANNDQMGWISFQGADGTNLVEGASIRGEVDGTPGANDMPGRLVFSTTTDGASSPTERMRLGANGVYWLFSSDDTMRLRTSSGAGTTYALIRGYHSGTGTTSGGTESLTIWNNGNVQNTNGSYTAISDAKLKENIVDAGSQWDDLKAIQIRNWNFKVETGHETHRQIGPIAQELEQVCPGLVFKTPDRDEDGNETGEVTKGVNQSVLYMKAVKALQEAMERIELLEARLDAANL